MGPSETRPSWARQDNQPGNQPFAEHCANRLIQNRRLSTPSAPSPSRTEINIPHIQIVPTTIHRRNGPLPISFLSPTQGHQVKITRARPMRLIAAWVRIQESDLPLRVTQRRKNTGSIFLILDMITITITIAIAHIKMSLLTPFLLLGV